MRVSPRSPAAGRRVVALSAALASSLALLFIAGGCPSDDDPEEIGERDREDVIPEPEIAGAAPDEFDPDERSRVVDPGEWGLEFRAAGAPGAVPTHLVGIADRSIVRRDNPRIGPATELTIRGESGDSIELAATELTDDHSVFRAEFPDDELTPGERYEVSLDRVELIFDDGGDTGEEDVEVIEPDGRTGGAFEVPPFELIDASAARPVGNFGHVELRFSAPVSPRELEESLSWSLDGAEPREVYYDPGERGRAFDVRLRAAGPSFSASVSEVELSGGAGLSSRLGGDPLQELRETLPVGTSSDGLEIRAVGTYERAGDAAIRVLCHDPDEEEIIRSHWDRDIGERVRDLSRRCDVDTDRVLDQIALGIEGEVSAADHEHGFDLILDARHGPGPVGFALRTGDLGAGAELYKGHDELLEPSFPGPQLALDADGRYLQREDWSRIPVRHQGVELARVVVRHAPESHFEFWLSGGDEMDGRTSIAVADDYLELDPGPDQARYSYADLEEIVGDPEPGAYQIEVSAPYQRGLRDTHRFLVSDLKLVAKRASHEGEEVDEIWAWTLGAERAEPESGVELELVRENGEVLAACETDGDGFCELSGNWGDLENEPPFAVVAHGGEELAYVDWEDTKTEIARGSVGGLDYADDPPHRGGLSGERTLYRPGETMSFAGYARNDERGAEAELPVGVEITDARGNEAYRAVYETDAAGAIEFDYELPELAATGSWDVELFTGDDVIASQSISVEEFVPERIEVDIDVDETYVAEGDGLRGELEGAYFFGAPAAGADFEVECRFEAGEPFEEEHPEYDFGPFADGIEEATARNEGALDREGEAAFHCDAPNLTAGAPYDVRVEAAVFEAGSGRPSRADAVASYLPGEEMVGLRSPQDRVDRDDGAEIEGIVVDPDGTAVSGADWVEIELGSIRYTTTRVRGPGRTRWERERHESVDETARLALDDGRFSIRASSRGPTSGLYVRAERRGAVAEHEIDAPRRFWGWGQRDLDPRPDDPAHVEIEGPESITVDEKAEFSFEAPAAGRALVAVETYRVDSWEWIEVEPGENTWEAGVEYFDPNVYVSALYIPTGEDAPQGLDRGFGVKRVDVSRSPWEAEVELDVPEEREPGDALTARVEADGAGDDAVVALAAVDRGILSMASYEFDDPLDQIFATRALGVDTFDTVGWYADVAPEVFGGGAAGAAPGPDPIMPVEPTAMWSGLVDLDGDGRAEVDFEIPDYRGELEIAAVVIGSDRLGAAREETTIRDPLALQATAPRFATHGDEVAIPAQVTNTTDRAIEVEISAESVADAAGPGGEGAELEIAGAGGGALELEPGEQGNVTFEVLVAGRAGAPGVAFEASGGGERSEHEVTLPIYPQGARTVESESHAVREAHFNVSEELEGWLPTSETTRLWVTSLPRAPAFEHLERVLYYPRLPFGANLYNTVARVRPAVYLDRLLDAADLEGGGRGVSWRVRRGVRGIQRLQQSSGRFSFWSSGTAPVSAWGQAYVLDMLVSADDAGYDVPSWVLRDGLDWLDRRVQRRQNLKDLDLALWVLARQGRPDRRAARALLDELPARPTGRDHERALLATASLYAAGDETARGDLRRLISEPALDGATRRAGGDRYSPARHEGLALEVAIQSFGADHELLHELAEDVAERLIDAERSELNLHELGWSIAGLGRWAEARMGAIPDARLVAGGREIDPVRVGDDGARAFELHRASEFGDVTLELDRAPDEPVTLFRRTEGVRGDAEPEFGGEVLSLRRRVRDVEGNSLDLAGLEVGDIAYVEIEIEHDAGETLENLALTSRIPGGFEIEDARPEGERRPDWFDAREAWSADHIEVRDDRLEAYGSIREGETAKVVFRARATAAGRFESPPTEIVSMYQSDRWARVRGETVEIARP